MQNPDEHIAISRQFVRHAKEELAAGERLQASEKVWGAVNHALAAIGKERGWPSEKYDQKKNIARYLSVEYRNPDIVMAYNSAEDFHENFYHNTMSADEVGEGIGIAETFVATIEAARESGPAIFTVRNANDARAVRSLTNKRVAAGQTYNGADFINQRRRERFERRWSNRNGENDDYNADDDTPLPVNPVQPDG